MAGFAATAAQKMVALKVWIGWGSTKQQENTWQEGYTVRKQTSINASKLKHKTE